MVSHDAWSAILGSGRRQSEERELGELGLVELVVSVVLVQVVVVVEWEDLGLVDLGSCSFQWEKMMRKVRHTLHSIAWALCLRCMRHRPLACCRCRKALTPLHNA